MTFPDGTWDTVTAEVDTPLVIKSGHRPDRDLHQYPAAADPGIPGPCACACQRHITEVEQVIATKRNVSAPPVPMGDAAGYHRDPALGATVPPVQRLSREAIRRLADGYF